MLSADFIKSKGCWFNPGRLDCVVWRGEDVDLYFSGRADPVSLGRAAFLDGLSLHHALHGRPPGRRPTTRAHLNVVATEGEDAG
jgi:hypothetical protein